VSGSISYSTLSPSAVVSHIWREYKVGELTGAEFLARGLNDTFRVQESDRTYVLPAVSRGLEVAVGNRVRTWNPLTPGSKRDRGIETNRQ